MNSTVSRRSRRSVRFLLRSLADLEREHDAGDVDDADYETLKDGYTARAAAVLRRIEAGRSGLAPQPTRRWGRTLAIAAGVLAAAVADRARARRGVGRARRGAAVCPGSPLVTTPEPCSPVHVRR